jgi:hypothetical protein
MINSETFIAARESLTDDNWFARGRSPVTVSACLWLAVSRSVQGSAWADLISQLDTAIATVDPTYEPSELPGLTKFFAWNDAQTELSRVKEVLTVAAEQAQQDDAALD